MISLEELHDATLVGFEVDWATGELRCRFDVWIGELTAISLRAQNLRNLKCPRLFPWGESVSVNRATTRRSENQIVLLIEMQSGDLIEALVDDVILE
jgi:hypothetical protein